MKKLLLLTLAFCAILTIQSQEITGQWNGLLEVPGGQLTIVFNIDKTETGYSATMDSPDQGAKNIIMTSATFNNSILKIAHTAGRIEFEGFLDENNIIKGTFKQVGYSIPLNLSRDKVVKKNNAKPQEPTQPYPYNSEAITFKNKSENITLAGTLTSPKQKGPFPTVILISGSGAQNRDEEILGHKPFLVLSDHLTKNGIAVLRFDDRGTAESEGNYGGATSLDLSTDVEAAVDFLMTRNEVDKNNIGLIGHSEGGILAPMVAARSKNIAFIVLTAGPGIPLDQLLLLQNNGIAKASGVSEDIIAKNEISNVKIYNIVKSSTDTEQLKIDLTAFLKEQFKDNAMAELPNNMSEEDYIKMLVAQTTSPWLHYFLKYDPVPTLKQVKCPVLAINGSKDLQVTAKENLSGIKTALEQSGNKNVTIKELPNLNHLFQESNTGLPSEYAQIEQTMSPIAMELITSWIKKQVK